MVKLFAAFLFCLPFLCGACWGQSYQPGFRTVSVWRDEPPTKLDISVWYPSTRQPKPLNYPPWTISGALNAKPAAGKFPLLLISHATPVDRFAYHSLAERLAAKGFVVVCPAHKRDCMDNMDDLFTWNQLAGRANEINQAIGLALSEKEIGDCVDSARIGLIGFGAGATTALLMGGAIPGCSSWPAYCRRAGENDPYCSPLAKDRINAICKSFPLNENFANTEIKAIAAVAPGFGMLFDAESFRHFYPPLLLVAAGSDRFNRADLHCGAIARHLGSKARFLDLPLADAGALISDCPEPLAHDLPELCLSLEPGKKAEIRNRLAETLLGFFSHYLRVAGNLPQTPVRESVNPKNAVMDQAKAETAGKSGG